MLLQTTEEHLLIKTSESGFHQSEDKRNCHKLRSSYATSILITKLTFALFLLKLSTLSAAIFLFVLSLLCGRSTGVFHQLLLFFSIRYQTLISDIDKFILACLLFDRPEILSNLNFVYESRHSLALHEYLQGGQSSFSLLYFSVFVIRR